MTTAELRKGDIIIPGSWGLVPLADVPKVVLDDRWPTPRIYLDEHTSLSATSADDARGICQNILDDLYRFRALQVWFETREERERKQVLHEFNADTEGNPLPHDVLVPALADEIIRLRKGQK